MVGSQLPEGGDVVDRVLGEWARARPDLDASPLGVVARVARLAKFLDAALTRDVRSFDLTCGDYDVLATLRRAGAPFRLPHKDLTKAVLRCSGTVSFRTDRLERRGLVRREPDPDDARGTLVALTEPGQRLIEEVVPAHLATEERLLAALTREERERLAGLLRKLLVGFEAAGPPSAGDRSLPPRTAGREVE